MEPEEDAYGQELMSYYKSRYAFEAFERDDGFLNANIGAAEYFSRYADWRSHEKAAIRYAKGRCLDVGCGAGRVALYLQAKGRRVTGIDESPLAIKVCRLRGMKDAKVMHIEDAGEFKQGSFDTILLYGVNFNLMQSRQKAKQILKAFYRITSPNGVVIAETRDPYLTSNPVHFAYHKRNLARGRMAGQQRGRIRFLQYASRWSDFLFVSKGELEGILGESGWKVRRFIDSTDFKKDGRFFAIIEKER